MTPQSWKELVTLSIFWLPVTQPLNVPINNAMMGSGTILLSILAKNMQNNMISGTRATKGSLAISMNGFKAKYT